MGTVAGNLSRYDGDEAIGVQVSNIVSVLDKDAVHPVLPLSLLLWGANISEVFEDPGPRVELVIDCSPEKRDKDLAPVPTDLHTR